MTRHRWAGLQLVGAGLVLMLSFVLRVYRLDAQSLWYDEGNSAVMATRTLQQIAANSAADIHPPLYYFLLHWWSGLAGTSEFALRYLSVAFGVLSVALLVAIGRRLASRTVAVVAGALAAVSPFLVYYAQEARMYAQLCALSTLSMYIFFKLLSPQTMAVEAATVQPGSAVVASGAEGHGDRSALDRRVLFAGYVLATAAALFTHYFAFAVLVPQLVIALTLVLRRQPWRPIARFALAQLVVGLLYLPWLLAVWQQFGTWSTSAESTALVELAHNLFLVFSFGMSWDATATGKSQLLVGAILLVGMAAELLCSKGSASGALLRAPAALLFFVVPLLVVVGLEIRRPTYQPKLVIPAAMAYDLLLALGIVTVGTLAAALASWLTTRVGTTPHWAVLTHATQVTSRHPWRTITQAIVIVLLLLLVAFFDSRSLRAYYLDPQYGRDDYRGLARFIETRELAGDAILLNAPNQIEVLDYYYQGALARYPLPRQRPLDVVSTAGDLAGLVATHRRVWVVEWAVRESDPQGFIENWLRQRYRGSQMGQFGQVKLTLYEVGGQTSGQG